MKGSAPEAKGSTWSRARGQEDRQTGCATYSAHLSHLHRAYVPIFSSRHAILMELFSFTTSLCNLSEIVSETPEMLWDSSEASRSRHQGSSTHRKTKWMGRPRTISEGGNGSDGRKHFSLRWMKRALVTECIMTDPDLACTEGWAQYTCTCLEA